MITHKTSRGLGLASKLGFPTVNVYKESSDTGVFVIHCLQHGPGVAFVMPSLTEIHFFSDVEQAEDEIDYVFVQKVEPPKNGILDYFYKGLACAED